MTMLFHHKISKPSRNLKNLPLILHIIHPPSRNRISSIENTSQRSINGPCSIRISAKIDNSQSSLFPTVVLEESPKCTLQGIHHPSTALHLSTTLPFPICDSFVPLHALSKCMMSELEACKNITHLLFRLSCKCKPLALSHTNVI